MTQQKTTFTTFNTRTLFRPPLLHLNDSKWIIFGARDGTSVYSVNVKTTPMKIKDDADFPRHIMVDREGVPNAVLYNNRYIYSFGGTKNPWIVKYDCVLCKFTDLNENDKLNMANANLFKISDRAKTQLLGEDHILICSKECEILLYDIKNNKFVNCQPRLFKDEEPCDMDILIPLTQYKQHRQTFYFISEVAQGRFVIEMKYALRVKVEALRNTFTIDFLRPILTFIPKYNTIICMGGSKIKGSDEIRLLNIKNEKTTTSKIKLPVELRDHGIIYIESNNCIYVVGGQSNQIRERNTTGYCIDFKLFKKDIEKIKS